MNLKRLKQNELIISLNNAVSVEKKAITDVLAHLQELESRKVYCVLGFDSLFTYLVRNGLYSDSEASIRISAMRLMKRAPEVRKKIEDSDITLTNAANLNRFLNEEEKGTGNKIAPSVVKDVIEKIEGKTTREAKAELDDIRQVEPKHRFVKIKIDSIFEKKLRRLSRLMENEMSEQNLFEHLVELKLTELKKSRKSRKANIHSRYISQNVKNFIKKRSGNRCEHVCENGARCNGTYRLHFDHKQAYSKGGTSDLDNIQHLCAQHNWKKSNS